MTRGKNQIAILQCIRDGVFTRAAITEKTGIGEGLVTQCMVGLKRDGIIVMMKDQNGKDVRGEWRCADGVNIDEILSGATIRKGGGSRKAANLADRFEKLLNDMIDLFAELRPLVLSTKEKEDYENLKKVKQLLNKMT